MTSPRPRLSKEPRPTLHLCPSFMTGVEPSRQPGDSAQQSWEVPSLSKTECSVHMALLHWNKNVGTGVSVGAAVGNVGAGVGVDDALYAEAAQWEASSPTRRRRRMGGARRGRTFVAAGQPR